MYDCMKNFRVSKDTDKKLKKVLSKNKKLNLSELLRDILNLKLDELLNTSH